MNEQADLILFELEERMQKAIDALVREFATIRTGRANPALLDRVMVDYYGVETPINQVGAISVPESNQLYIKPFDKSVLKDIEKAILESPLGLTPANDGVGIRLSIPQLTEDKRKQLVKDVEKLSEGGKVAVRNIRRDGNDQIKKIVNTEDEEKGYLEDVQTLTDKFIKEVEHQTVIKSEELLKI
jgi:ribosome recycling factor